MREQYVGQIQDILRREKDLMRLSTSGLDDAIKAARNSLNGVNNNINETIEGKLRLIDKQIKDSVRFNKYLSVVDQLASSLPKFDLRSNVLQELDLIRKNVANQNKLASEFPQHTLAARDKYLDDTSLSKAIRQQQELIKSNFGSAVFAASLRQDEVDLIRQNVSDITRYTTLDLPKTFPQNFLTSLNQSKVWEQIDTLRDSFAGKLAIEFRDVFENSKNQQEAFSKIGNIIEERTSEMPQSKFTKVELSKLAYAVFILVLSFYASGLQTCQFFDSKKSGEEQKAQNELLVNLMKEIVKNTTQEKADFSNEFYYEVQRETQLKTKPSFNSITINNLIPKSRARVIFTNHKWIYIECFNYLEGVPQYGWVNKKYLKKMK